ncbi:granulocyte-macrophage colony-stimulating factor receptor subunit alpha-like isoform X2 [Marmota marmota marmota]|uniref:granulocyte-macrophage colony-stimulating factor receptor subunit alpha-like isoform X2 n=1 Tax=Marmota marmota marmota TaxID=9994 RepID=UPI0020927E37|nr:granulocyte-macrophage colony-stimulating factor receptor subunit alpha-like isoform X2 [Marmota marmota marmota]
MAALWASAWLLMLVRPALGEGQQPLAADNASPVLNLKLDPRKKLLTWRYSREVTQHSCRIVTPLAPATSTSPRGTADLAYRCAFPNALLHRGATLTLRGSSRGGDFEEELVFPSTGKEGSRATGFSCFIYDVRFMNCSWTRGPAAPADVQYHLYSWFSRDEDETECAQYMVDSAGVHVGCHFEDLGEAKTTDNYFFLLNGTSNAVAVQFLDFAPLVAFKIEKYNPPANVTVHYNASSHSHVIRWLNPHRRYDLASSTFRAAPRTETLCRREWRRPLAQKDMSWCFPCPCPAQRFPCGSRARGLCRSDHRAADLLLPASAAVDPSVGGQLPGPGGHLCPVHVLGAPQARSRRHMSVSSPGDRRPSGAADIHAAPPPGSTWVPSTDPFSSQRSF